MTVRDELDALCAYPLPALGSGRTAERWLRMYQWALSGSVSVARLAEAHADAVAILAEADQAPVEGAVYGVWASTDRRFGVRLDDAGTLTGTKALCSGLGVVDRALILVTDERGRQVLVDVEASGASVALDTSGWSTSAMADTATGTVQFDRHPAHAVVGDDGWYLDRPGFWNGAIGPAACWAGAAGGIAEHTETLSSLDEHQLVARGALRAESALCRTLLSDAGRETDRSPDDRTSARRRTYVVRHLVERSTARTVDAFGRAFGPRPFVADGHLAQRIVDVLLYVRQQHGDRDLAELGAPEDGA